jgi:hypothetical protein
VHNNAGEIVKPGDILIVRGEGMPAHGKPSEKGDLYVQFDVQFPKFTELKIPMLTVCTTHPCLILCTSVVHTEGIHGTFRATNVETKHGNGNTRTDTCHPTTRKYPTRW